MKQNLLGGNRWGGVRNGAIFVLAGLLFAGSAFAQGSKTRFGYVEKPRKQYTQGFAVYSTTSHPPVNTRSPRHSAGIVLADGRVYLSSARGYRSDDGRVNIPPANLLMVSSTPSYGSRSYHDPIDSYKRNRLFAQTYTNRPSRSGSGYYVVPKSAKTSKRYVRSSSSSPKRSGGLLNGLGRALFGKKH